MTTDNLPAAPYCVPASATPDERGRIIAARAREALSDPYVQSVARGIVCSNCSPRERASAVLRRAQAAGFVPDPPGCDAYRPVAITLRQGGDCDDLTPVVMALGELAGFQARVAYLSQPRAPQDHVTGMLLVDGEWMWAEPSLKGARLGEHPYDAAKRLGRFDPFGGTGSVAGVTDGILANLLTLGILAGAAYLGAKHGSRGTRSNPTPRSNPVFVISRGGQAAIGKKRFDTTKQAEAMIKKAPSYYSTDGKVFAAVVDDDGKIVRFWRGGLFGFSPTNVISQRERAHIENAATSTK